MASTFMGLEIARRGLSVHQQALATTGHNISNADNEHYARQKVNFSAMQPIYDPALNRPQGAGMLGQGVAIDAIERVRDHFIDDRIIQTEQSTSYWKIKESYYSQVEIVYNEPSDQALKSSMDKFWSSWQELSQFPEEYAHREVVKTRAEELVYSIRNTYERLAQLRKQADMELQTGVERLNSMASEVKDLNTRILNSQTMGDNPNDLLDKRDQLLQEMSSLADVSISRADPDELIVYLGGEVLVQGKLQNKIITFPDSQNEGLSTLQWEHNKSGVVTGNGSLHALKEIRDVVLKDNIDKMDLMALNIADVVNEVHRDGFGLNNETNKDFFTLKSLSRNIMGNVDLNSDGQNDTSAVFKIAGRNAIQADRPIGINGILTFVKNDERHTEVRIAYRADETAEEVIKRINKSGAGVVAYMDHNDKLVLKGDIAGDEWQKNFMMRHLEDSGEFLVGYSGVLQNSGLNGAFDYRRIDEVNKLQGGGDAITLSPTYHPAGSLQLNDEIKNNIALIAAGSGRDLGGTGDVNAANGQKDGSNALAIAQAMRHQKTMVGEHNNAEDFYSALIGKLGVDSRAASDSIENHNLIMKNLEGLRQSIMGVNLDEEMANMVQFQHAYNASAKVIQMMNELLDQIINKLG